jgi:hypothetical protein
LNYSSNKRSIDAGYEFLAVQLAQEPLELFRAVGYPECTTLEDFPVGTLEHVSNKNGVYPAEVEMFDRLITLNTSKLPFCSVTVKVYPRSKTRALYWMGSDKPAVIITGVIPYVR